VHTPLTLVSLQILLAAFLAALAGVLDIKRPPRFAFPLIPEALSTLITVKLLSIFLYNTQEIFITF
jgi:ABC-type Co2+ transport system permease subunit